MIHIFESKSTTKCLDITVQGDDVSRIMFGMRSKIKELVKLIKLVIVQVN